MRKINIDKEMKIAGRIIGTILIAATILIYFLWNPSSKPNQIIKLIWEIIGTVVGLIGLIKPKWFLYVEKLGPIFEDHSRKSQTQQNTKGSNQFMAGGDINNYFPNPKNIPEEKESDEKKDLIKDISDELPKGKCSEILMKGLRLANITQSEKDKLWIENEIQGFFGIIDDIKEKDIPLYRKINTEIRVDTDNAQGYTSLRHPLLLGHPIFQIEEWIEDYEKKKGEGLLILRAEASETMKKIHKKQFGADLPSNEVPYIIPTSELKKVITQVKLKISRFINSIK